MSGRSAVIRLKSPSYVGHNASQHDRSVFREGNQRGLGTMSLIGKRLGNYDIHSKIGEGGMGIVYMGVHPQIGKKVAVKVLHPELSDKADVVTRFFNER